MLSSFYEAVIFGNGPESQLQKLHQLMHARQAQALIPPSSAGTSGDSRGRPSLPPGTSRSAASAGTLGSSGVSDTHATATYSTAELRKAGMAVLETREEAAGLVEVLAERLGRKFRSIVKAVEVTAVAAATAEDQDAGTSDRASHGAPASGRRASQEGGGVEGREPIPAGERSTSPLVPAAQSGSVFDRLTVPPEWVQEMGAAKRAAREQREREERRRKEAIRMRERRVRTLSRHLLRPLDSVERDDAAEEGEAGESMNAEGDGLEGASSCRRLRTAASEPALHSPKHGKGGGVEVGGADLVAAAGGIPRRASAHGAQRDGGHSQAFRARLAPLATRTGRATPRSRRASTADDGDGDRVGGGGRRRHSRRSTSITSAMSPSQRGPYGMRSRTAKSRAPVRSEGDPFSSFLSGTPEVIVKVRVSACNVMVLSLAVTCPPAHPPSLPARATTSPSPL